MRESTTYQAILREGRPKGRLKGRSRKPERILFRLGRKRFGQPKAAIKAKIEALTDLDRLEQLSDRVLDAKSWDELIGTK